MNYTELKINLSSLPGHMKDILVAELGQVGFESFMEEKGILLAYIPANNYNEKVIIKLADEFEHFQFEANEIEQQNWNAQWESDFEPVIINKFCFIRAPFHKPKPGFEHEIVIEPKMSFGTGHHATTRLMLQLMLKAGINKKEVLDMGCGTGILAIMAKKMGASKVTGIDIDEWAVENTVENAEKNNVSGLTVYKGTAENIQGKFDIILANINRNILVNDMSIYSTHLKKGGYILFSGFYQNDEPIIESSCKKNELHRIGQLHEDQWSALLFQKT